MRSVEFTNGGESRAPLIPRFYPTRFVYLALLLVEPTLFSDKERRFFPIDFFYKWVPTKPLFDGSSNFATSSRSYHKFGVSVA